MFLLLHNLKTGKPTLINSQHVDEISAHNSGTGTQIWSTKPGNNGWHVRESFDEIKKMMGR